MMELTEQQIVAFRQQLLALRQDLEELMVLSSDSASVVELDQTKVGRLSRMDALQQQHLATAKRQAYLKRLKQIEHSLIAIDTGAYGYCAHCGEPINLQRLKIKPESLLCIDCQSVSE